MGLCVIIFFSNQLLAQKETVISGSEMGDPNSAFYFKTQSPYTLFPDSARLNGHIYEGNYFAYKDHYDDSTVQIYIPPNFNPKKTIELIIWFHGWYNNIDSATRYFGLTEQFRLAHRNAIFIFPEGPKNAPDSYGGKLERPEMFTLFINDLLKKIEAKKVLPKIYTIQDCKITLSGHSGAYRVISKIIQYNKIDELILFDAMYGGNDAYLKWIAENKKHRFIHIYTKEGGTFDNTRQIMQQLKDSLKVAIISVNEDDLKMNDLRNDRPLFIYSNNEHNEVIKWNINWYRFLHHWKKHEQWLESKPLTKENRDQRN